MNSAFSTAFCLCSRLGRRAYGLAGDGESRANTAAQLSATPRSGSLGIAPDLFWTPAAAERAANLRRPEAGVEARQGSTARSGGPQGGKGLRAAAEGERTRMQAAAHRAVRNPADQVPEGGWAFDVEAGRQEMLVRRIGRNELDVIDLRRPSSGGQ